MFEKAKKNKSNSDAIVGEEIDFDNILYTAENNFAE